MVIYPDDIGFISVFYSSIVCIFSLLENGQHMTEKPSELIKSERPKPYIHPLTYHS